MVQLYEFRGDVLVMAFKEEGESPIQPHRVKSAKLIKPVNPNNPEQANLPGTCALTVVVRTDGDVGEIRVKKSLRPDYDEKAIEAVRQFRFKPALLDGEPVALELKMEVNFSQPKP